MHSLLIILILGISGSCGYAEKENELLIAVAANFSNTMKKLVAAYSPNCNCLIKIVTGSTGKLYTQISLGAPYDVFFSADMLTVTKLALENSTIALPIAYANGELVLYGKNINNKINSDIIGKLESAEKIALANPKLAPYGMAAVDFLKYHQILQTLSSRLVYGENVSQAFQFAWSGSVDYAFVPLSTVYSINAKKSDYLILSTSSEQTPIEQGAVALNDRAISTEFLQFVQSRFAQNIIESSGYRPLLNSGSPPNM